MSTSTEIDRVIEGFYCSPLDLFMAALGIGKQNIATKSGTYSTFVNKFFILMQIHFVLPFVIDTTPQSNCL